MPLENPFWEPVKVAFRRIADLPDLESFVTGGSYVQGVQLNLGDRFLLYDENRPEAVTGTVGNGIFVVAYDHEDGWYRPAGAVTEDDFETGKQVVVLDGDFVGTWTFTSTFPTLTFERLAYWTSEPPVEVASDITAPTGSSPATSDTGITAPTGTSPVTSDSGVTAKSNTLPEYVYIGARVGIAGIKQPANGGRFIGNI
jgi:hypothetical protein